jgi:hypothetical protein
VARLYRASSSSGAGSGASTTGSPLRTIEVTISRLATLLTSGGGSRTYCLAASPIRRKASI